MKRKRPDNSSTTYMSLKIDENQLRQFHCCDGNSLVRKLPARVDDLTGFILVFITIARIALLNTLIITTEVIVDRSQ